MTEYIDSYTR